MSYKSEIDLRIEARDILEGPLSIETCTRVIEIITLLASDDEVAHSLEDQFREAVLKHIDHPFAKIALKSSLIDFSRWCA